MKKQIRYTAEQHPWRDKQNSILEAEASSTGAGTGTGANGTYQQTVRYRYQAAARMSVVSRLIIIPAGP